jgi:hypothetical protein
MTKDISERIQSANERLKDALLRVRIVRLEKHLYIQATLPPKPDSFRDYWCQQKIATGKPATLEGLRATEKLAYVVGGKLIEGTFSWEPYIKVCHKPEKVRDWIEKFEQEFKPKVAPVTWKTDYRNVFNKLPPDALLTAKLLRAAAEKTGENSRTRKRYVQAFSRLAKFAGIEIDLRHIKGTYSATAVEPRDLPSDEQIVECFNSISSPGWRWVFGMLATFGLRNHEVFYLDIDPLMMGESYIRVTEGKTKGRMVWAFYPEWVEHFKLADKVLPPVSAKTHEGYGVQNITNFGR